MSLFDLRRSEELRRIGEKLGRKEIAERALKIAKQIVEADSYKNAIAGLGRMKVLAQCCGFDSYWKEKRIIGEDREYEQLLSWEKFKKWWKEIKVIS